MTDPRDIFPGRIRNGLWFPGRRTKDLPGPSPRPWAINEDFFKGNGHGPSPAPIVDAEGLAVVDSSEWTTLSRSDAELIVAAVNARSLSSG